MDDTFHCKWYFTCSESKNKDLFSSILFQKQSVGSKFVSQGQPILDIAFINPLPGQFKSLLHGQEGCVFFSEHSNVHKYHYVLVRLASAGDI
jgi:hypothetical protein